MLSASDIDTYRICPLKYKFARVFRIPQEPTIHQRFGIVLHQVLERFHPQGGGPLVAAEGAVRDLLAALGLRRLGRRAAVPRARGRGARALLARSTASRMPSRSGSSARSRSSSARTCCAGASTAWTATPTAPTS